MEMEMEIVKRQVGVARRQDGWHECRETDPYLDAVAAREDAPARHATQLKPLPRCPALPMPATKKPENTAHGPPECIQDKLT